MIRCKACNAPMHILYRNREGHQMLEELCHVCLRAAFGYYGGAFDDPTTLEELGLPIDETTEDE